MNQVPEDQWLNILSEENTFSFSGVELSRLQGKERKVPLYQRERERERERGEERDVWRGIYIYIHIIS